MQSGPPQDILSGSHMKFDWEVLEDSAFLFIIQWKCISKYNPRGNGDVERMVGTLKKASWKVTRSESKE